MIYAPVYNGNILCKYDGSHYNECSLMPPIFGGIMPHAGDLNAGSRAVTQNRTDSKDQISNISKYQASPLNTTMIFASSFYNFSLKYEVNWSRYN